MKKIIIVGGGWAGCAAALAAKHTGAHVTLFEKNDLILGTGLVGGIYRNNGRYTAAEEMIYLGAGQLFTLLDEQCIKHKNINFPGHQHASLYNIYITESIVKSYLVNQGIDIVLNARVSEVLTEGRKVKAVITNGKTYEADSFVDATGTAGPQRNCIKYGNGCVMCIIRCPSFGGRISIAARSGGDELSTEKRTFQALSGSCKIDKNTLSEEIVEELNTQGVYIYPLPLEERKSINLSLKACQQYAINEYADNIVFLDTGQAKMMSPFIPLETLNRLPGLEKARYVDPYSGSKGNSIRFTSITFCDFGLRVLGVDNLFCAGEKIGLAVGHTEAIVSGSVAGHNAGRFVHNDQPLILPDQLCTGDYLKYVIDSVQQEQATNNKFTFSGATYFERMKNYNLYTTNKYIIKERIDNLGLADIFLRYNNQ